MDISFPFGSLAMQGVPDFGQKLSLSVNCLRHGPKGGLCIRLDMLSYEKCDQGF
jgi:hypothetical protein